MTYQLDADCELPPHLVELFLKSAPTHLRELLDACKQRNSEAARAHAHKLKGGLYAAGASRLAERVEALRQIVGTDWPGVEQQGRTIQDEFASVLSQLRGRLNGGGT